MIRDDLHAQIYVPELLSTGDDVAHRKIRLEHSIQGQRFSGTCTPTTPILGGRESSVSAITSLIRSSSCGEISGWPVSLICPHFGRCSATSGDHIRVRRERS